MKHWTKESDFQKEVIDRIKTELPGAVVMKNDSSYIQGIPDLSVMYGDRYAMLEIKKSAEDRRHPQPNQETYISKFDDWGAFSKFIYPENYDETIAALKGYFERRA